FAHLASQRDRRLLVGWHGSCFLIPREPGWRARCPPPDSSIFCDFGLVPSMSDCGPSVFRVGLFDDLGDPAGTDRAATLTNREPQPLIHRDRSDQLHRHLSVVPRHHHLSPLRQRDRPRHIRRPEIKLRPIPRKERIVPTTLLL